MTAEEVARAVSSVIETPGALHAMARSSAALCEGKGVERVVRSLEA
jgi:hypothetical protein